MCVCMCVCACVCVCVCVRVCVHVCMHVCVGEANNSGYYVGVPMAIPEKLKIHHTTGGVVFTLVVWTGFYGSLNGWTTLKKLYLKSKACQNGNHLVTLIIRMINSGILHWNIFGGWKKIDAQMTHSIRIYEWKKWMNEKNMNVRMNK